MIEYTEEQKWADRLCSLLLEVYLKEKEIRAMIKKKNKKIDIDSEFPSLAGFLLKKVSNIVKK